MSLNDNDLPTRALPAVLSDADGQAALLLVESLMHGLCENGTLSTRDAINITDRAIDVQHEKAEAAEGAGAPMWRAHGLLTSIAASLRIDDKASRSRLV